MRRGGCSDAATRALAHSSRNCCSLRASSARGIVPSSTWITRSVRDALARAMRIA
jgi:hypothetical protein